VALLDVGLAVAATPNAPVTVTLTPSEVMLAPGGTQVVVAVVANAGAKQISALHLVWYGGVGSGVKVSPPSDDNAAVLANGSKAFVFTVTKSATPTKKSVLTLQTTYRDDAAAVDRVTVTALSVGAAEREAKPEAVVTVDVESAATELQQFRSTDVNLTITNGTAGPRSVTTVTIATPPFVCVTFRGSDALPSCDEQGKDEEPPTLAPSALTIPGGQQASMLFHLTMDRALEPGDAFLVFTVMTSSDSDQSTASTAKAVKLKFAVLGESGFLDAVGVQSVYLLPGLVFAVALWMLVHRVFPKPTGTADDDAPKVWSIESKVVFWVTALPVCLILPVLYPRATDLVLGAPRDYRRAYGFDDIFYVWTLAAVLALAVWLIRWVVPSGIDHLWRRLFVPVPGDSPARLLWKLARSFGSLKRQSVTYTADASPEGRFLRDTDGGKTVVMPRILIAVADQQVMDEVANDHRIRTAWHLSLFRHRRGGRVWYAGNGNVTLVDAAAITVGAARVAIVEVAATVEGGKA
jgi:hypothetical protein